MRTDTIRFETLFYITCFHPSHFPLQHPRMDFASCALLYYISELFHAPPPPSPSICTGYFQGSSVFLRNSSFFYLHNVLFASCRTSSSLSAWSRNFAVFRKAFSVSLSGIDSLGNEMIVHFINLEYKRPGPRN